MTNRRRRDRATRCGCGIPTPNGEQTCEGCLALLEQAIADLTWLDQELETAISRQRGVDTSSTGSHSSGSTPLPWNDQASRARRRLQSTLAGWVERIHRLPIQPDDQLPDGEPTRWTITVMARWLARRVDLLAKHRAGYHAMLDIRSVVAATTQTVLYKRQARIFLGPCNAILLDPRTLIPTGACIGEVYADEGDFTGRCEHCRATYSVASKRAELERELDDRLFTAAGIAALSTFLGLEMPRDRVRNLVNQWHHRGLIESRGTDHSETPPSPMFPYGEVRTMLARVAAERRGA